MGEATDRLDSPNVLAKCTRASRENCSPDLKHVSGCPWRRLTGWLIPWSGLRPPTPSCPCTAAATSSKRSGEQLLYLAAVLRPHVSQRPSSRIGRGPLTCGFIGGAEGTRTPDPLVANEVRYQLRHSPVVRTKR